jgi:hypothetical protein
MELLVALPVTVVMVFSPPLTEQLLIVPEAVVVVVLIHLAA